jgi:Papain family cysteine protease
MPSTQLFVCALLFSACASSVISEDEPGAIAQSRYGAMSARLIQEGDAWFIELGDGTRIPRLEAPSLAAYAAMQDASNAPFYSHEDASDRPARDTLPVRYTLADQQTPLRNQLSRRTCWVFAGTAAIEARYKRDFGITVDLSEQFLNHVAKSTGLHPGFYKYENQSSYWGGGTTAASISAATGFAIPFEDEAPYLDQGAMNALKNSIPGAGDLVWSGDPARNFVTQQQVDAFEYSERYISLTAREQAKFGVARVRLLRTQDARNTETLERLIASDHEVAIDVDLFWRFDESTQVFEHNPGERSWGQHAFLIVGYDREAQTFTVKNSWGETDFLQVRYEFFRHNTFGATVVDAVTSPGSMTTSGLWMGRWAMNHDGWAGELVIRRVPASDDSQVKLGTYYDAQGDAHAVNGRVSGNGADLSFEIADTDEPNARGGQTFKLHRASAKPRSAAGYTILNERFGVLLSRSAITLPPAPPRGKTQWLGTWDVSIDGVPATLSLTRLEGDTLTGEYRTVAGARAAVRGILSPQRFDEALFTVEAGGMQNATVFAATYWTQGSAVFAGLTSDGRDVSGFRR